MSAIYKVRGGEPVIGEIKCFGTKNFATKAMIATLLADEPSTLTNVPNIGDIHITLEMFESVGVTYDFDVEKNTITVNPSTINKHTVPLPDSGSNRMPILLLNPLLHKFGEAIVPVLGGCQIGDRKVDFHLTAIEKFGGKVEETEIGFTATAPNRLHGTTIELPYPSVGATETCLMLASLAQGNTIIRNAAIEPEIFELITLLRSMGAIIFTQPGRVIKIEGVEKLNGTTMNILGDRIEAASWACLACASDGEITVHGFRPDTLGNFLAYFQQTGGGFQILSSDTVKFYRKSKQLRPVMLETNVYPGFSTDWQQPFAIMLTQAYGTSVIHETVYENRFGYLKALNKLGAKTQLTNYCLGNVECRFKDLNHPHSAIIMGCTPLTANGHIEVPDLRAGLAYFIAAQIAKGETEIRGIERIERGYGNLLDRLKATNVNMIRE